MSSRGADVMVWLEVTGGGSEGSIISLLPVSSFRRKQHLETVRNIRDLSEVLIISHGQFET